MEENINYQIKSSNSGISAKYGTQYLRYLAEALCFGIPEAIGMLDLSSLKCSGKDFFLGSENNGT